jgi:hypothetical protein
VFWGHFPAVFQNRPRTAQRLSNKLWALRSELSKTLLAVPSGCPIAFQNNSQQLLAKTEQFLAIFLKAAFFKFFFFI